MKSILARFKSRISISPIAVLFAASVAVSFAIYGIYYAVSGNANFVDVFFLRCQDLFMDFFNSVRDASQGEEVYTVRHVIYPPMANLIYLICSRFIPITYNETDWYSRLSFGEYKEAIFFIVLFTLALLLVFYTIVYETVKGARKTKFLFSFFAVFNIPVLFMIERGNMILFCFIALMIYAFTYNSEKKIYRELGLLCLAFAFSLKLYPVVFGWFLLTDRRYKEAIRCASYGIIMLVLPSLFFGGLDCFAQIFTNITSFSTNTVNSLAVISGYSKIPLSILSLIAYLWCGICAACFILSPFIFKRRWKCWLMGIVTILTVPSLTTLYMWAFLLIPIIMLANLEKRTKKDYFFFFVTLSLFLFTIFRFNYYLTVNSFLLYPLTAILSVTAVADTLISGVRKLRSGAHREVTEVD